MEVRRSFTALRGEGHTLLVPLSYMFLVVYWVQKSEVITVAIIIIASFRYAIIFLLTRHLKLFKPCIGSYGARLSDVDHAPHQLYYSTKCLQEKKD